jgi:nitrite reductase (NO-forming)
MATLHPDNGNAPRSNWHVVITSAVRAAFGVIWAVDAYLVWQPAFAANFVGYLRNAAHGQPGWLQPWFAVWLGLVTPGAGLFIRLTRLLETAIALGLLLGLARRWLYVVGGLFSLLIWSTAEGFGGPYAAGAANLGPALLYVLMFIALGVFDRTLGRTPYSLDYYLGRRWPRWQRVAEWAPPSVRERTPPRLSWLEQAAAMLAIAGAFVFLLGTLRSALQVASATPENAAAAVAPLELAASAPTQKGSEAALPPLLGTGDGVNITLTASDATVEIASDVTYQAWTFDGTVPGPVLHVRQGQTVNVTFVNQGKMDHSIDFHAAQVPPDIAYRSIPPGQQLHFSFVAQVPGVFVYHCGTPPVLLHMANGMYGALVVDPARPLPPAAASYVLVQSEWYTQQVRGSLMAGNFTKMRAVTPDEVVFNGVAFKYRDHPLPARAGQRVRLYVVDAGPNLPSAFHAIGAIFEAVYPDGDAGHALTGVSTYPVAPGQGVVFDLIFPEPGEYPIVDHSMRNMGLGASGLIEVSR